jgi:hypothetical protein
MRLLCGCKLRRGGLEKAGKKKSNRSKQKGRGRKKKIEEKA